LEKFSTPAPSSIEIEVGRGRCSETEKLIKEILNIYDKLTEPGKN